MPLSIGRPLAGAAAVLALAVSLAGCRGAAAGAKAGTTPETPLAAARTALRQASARAAALTDYRASLAFISKHGDAHHHLNGELAYRASPDQAMQLDVPELYHGCTHILLNGTLYLRVNDEATQTPWTALPLARLRAHAAVMALFDSEFHQVDPSAYATMFTASRDAHAVGTETIDGARTTRYQGGFTYADAEAEMSAGQRARMRPIWADAAGSGRVSFIVWVDDRHLVRRIIMSTPEGKSERLNATINYSGFDVPVDISAPPTAQVRHGARLAGGDANLPT